MPSAAKAQLEKGRLLVGGGLNNSFRFSDNENGETNSLFNLTISPRVGVVAFKNFLVGLHYTIGISNNRVEKNFDIRSELGPFLRYYVGRKQNKFVSQIGISYLNFARIHDGNTSSQSGFSPYVSAGYAYFINSNVALESLLNFSYSKYEHSWNYNTGISLGFQIFFNGKKKEETAG